MERQGIKMKVSEKQLLMLLSVVKEVVDGTLDKTLTDAMLPALKNLYDEIMEQQNEIVDTHHYGCRNDEYLRLAIDLFESLEVTFSENIENFYQSPMGKRARSILYPDNVKREQDAIEQNASECHICHRPNNLPGGMFCSAPHGRFSTEIEED